MHNHHASTVPFAVWAALARRDPVAFEAARTAMVEELLARAAPERQARLRALQWGLDQLRARASTPARACDALATRLWERAMGPDGLAAQLALAPETRPSAAVLPFPADDDSRPGRATRAPR